VRKVTMRTLILAAALALTGCTSHNDAKRALEGAGYTNIELGGYAWFDCGRGDDFATEFKATGPTGKRVQGAVCTGWFKGSTIRID
jgi:hypothetical protein